MSIASLGITHCSECGTALSMQEFGMCKNCREKTEKEKKEKIEVKTADKMFEELGYVKAEDKYRIEYALVQNFTHFNVIKKIYFYKIEKDITLEQWNVTEGIKINMNLVMQELKAINKKCEELRWK